MNGPELAETLLRQMPGLPVLFTTGYPNLGAGRGEVLPAGADVLQKPYRRRELMARLAPLLRKRPAA